MNSSSFPGNAMPPASGMVVQNGFMYFSTQSDSIRRCAIDGTTLLATNNQCEAPSAWWSAPGQERVDVIVAGAVNPVESCFHYVYWTTVQPNNGYERKLYRYPAGATASAISVMVIEGIFLT